jgi:hypothetical protein
MAQLKHPAKSVKGVPTAGNRIRATTKEQLWARFGQWSAQAKAAYDPVKLCSTLSASAVSILNIVP